MRSFSRALKPAPSTGVVDLPRPESTAERQRAGESETTEADPVADLAAIVDSVSGRLTRASRRILHDHSLADDAIQEALLTFWSRDDRPANSPAWLVHAVTLRSLQLARTRRRRREHERRASLDRPESSLRDDPSRSVDYEDLLRILQEALGSVADESREVFVLWAFEELDYAGIAEALRIPVGTVRSRLSRTRRAIREVLESRMLP